ncbi:Lsr2 family protein [Citricoccus sp. SGAir0253]|uniref:histone-like nucleoid-structuring protein Lsr2 n=1 Tax=Citricoccus sp. SGAir0253 TaxID=2567881 RepID=UPI0010CCFBC3|nr:Lsr2 family protein [Citricoccus sp. SGAir0253]QCU77956.1 Lsr2 family protein [Citricoccus sp. SGAir0253]
MAQKAEVVLIDDLDGTPARETITFGVDGRHYEIDLSAAHAKQLRQDLKAYVRAGRAIAPPAPRRQAAAIRQWAKQNGYEIPDRGRIHQDIVAAYNAAGQK